MAESEASVGHLSSASPILLLDPEAIAADDARREESSTQCFKTRTTSDVAAVEDSVSPTALLNEENEGDAHSSDNDWEKVSLSEVKDAPALIDDTAASLEGRASGAQNEENSSFELNDDEPTGTSRPKRKRTLPAWMVDDAAIDDGEEPISKGRGRSKVAPRGQPPSSRATGSKSKKDEFEDEEEEEQQPKLAKRGSTRQAAKPKTPPRDDFEEGPSKGRAKRATAAKRVSYIYDDYVDDSELSKDSEEFNRKSRSKKRKKDDSEEDWTGDDDSDDDWGSRKKGKKAAGRGSKRSGRHSDDDESDDEAYVPRLSRRRSGLDSVESSQTAFSVTSPSRRGRSRSAHQQSSESPSPSKAASGSGSLAMTPSPQKANASVHAKKRKVDLSDDDNNDDKDEIDARKVSSAAAKPAANKKKGRKICMFGAKCYRKAAEHRHQYSHPGDDDYVDPSEEPKDDEVEDKPECEFGTTCFRKNPQHRRDYSHTKPSTRQAAKKTHHTDSDDDLDDEEEEAESESGSDYDPSGDDETPKKTTKRGAPAKRGRKEKV